MAEKKRAKRFRPTDRDRELSQEELDAEPGEQLPDREAMSVIDANVAIPANPAVAASVLAGGSQADDPHDPSAADEEDQGEGGERGEEDRAP